MSFTRIASDQPFDSVRRSWLATIASMAGFLSRPEVFGEADNASLGTEGNWEMIPPGWLASTAVVKVCKAAVQGCLF